ncbi:putative 2-pyrone-4,6-dicarboxylic acid (PDC) hydrolase [Erwinia amylovora Ea644]|uniref:amidohydrolase family protein n=1 Tax=Erwinia amylovora TaxID=552 RepID=UPI0002CCCF78|nr:amidohydrolase family protein [Erwinia amylovora]CCP03379.1 putative 2-pyrone-4,6-dicarboxylic acid (PDC) hydrolase [Erwinia amylovora Ea644]CCP07397.1 putative 2-pyrone-4,6-dicarboxylic acid (PDC) hydrolase [Erwinia amylovora MR1]
MFTQPIIDCHHHVFDPARFPWSTESAYNPQGHELATPDYYRAVMTAYNIRHSLIVGPTSGYNTDNRCLLDTLRRGEGRFKGIAVVHRDTNVQTLANLQSQGVIGIALNVAMLGTDPFLHLDKLMSDLADLNLFAQIQVQDDQLLALLPLLARTRTRILFDHCGRPDVSAGPGQPAFRALLSLAGGERCSVKLSGLAKFSRQPYPFSDGHPYLLALLDAFGAENCMWGSDWPFLRASERMDMGTQLLLVNQLIPDDKTRRQVLWETPERLFNFGSIGAL